MFYGNYSSGFFMALLNRISFQKEAEKTTKSILDALGEDYSISCEGIRLLFLSIAIELLLNLLKMNLCRRGSYEI